MPDIPRQTLVWLHIQNPIANISMAWHAVSSCDLSVLFPSSDLSPSDLSPQGFTAGPKPEGHKWYPFHQKAIFLTQQHHHTCLFVSRNKTFPFLSRNSTDTWGRPLPFLHGHAVLWQCHPSSKAMWMGASLSLPFTLVQLYNGTILGQVWLYIWMQDPQFSLVAIPHSPPEGRPSVLSVTMTNETLSDLHDRALPWVPRFSPFPNISHHCIAWLSFLSCCTGNILQRRSPPRCLEKLQNRSGWACFLVVCFFLVLWNNHKHSNYCKDKIARIRKSSQAKLSIN